MEILVIILLIVFNGVLAMAEFAIISSKKSRLQQLANDGDKKAQIALDLSKSPNKFLSTIQVGITLIGIFAGAFGGATITNYLAVSLKNIPLISNYAGQISLLIVVLLITFLSLVIGELVPKRLALAYPERFSRLLAPFMDILSNITSPIINFLSFSTELVLKPIKIRAEETEVSEEDVKSLIKEGARIGIFDIAEKDIVERTFRLSDRKVSALMTPRKEIIWLTIDSSYKTIRNKIFKNPYSNFPVYQDNQDKVLGVVRKEDLLTNFIIEEKINLKKSLYKPLFIPENLPALKALEQFKRTGIHVALVIDEFGNIQGLLTINDIIEAIVGDLPTAKDAEEKEIVERDDGSWLIDGLVPIEEMKEILHIKKLPGEKSGNFITIGGLIMYKLNRIPRIGDKFELDNYILEIVDMDGNRVDKVLLTPITKR